MKVVYVAHPLGHGEGREANRRNASAWVARIADLGVAPVADWIILSGEWAEDRRDEGLAIDMALVARCDEVWLVGGRVSPGMAAEAATAKVLGKPVRDLTSLGFTPPADLSTLMQRIGDAYSEDCR